MKKKTVLVLIALLSLFIMAILAFAQEVDAEQPENPEKVLQDARNLLLEKDTGAASLVLEASRLLFLGTAWEGKARMLFLQAITKSEKASLLVAPLIDESGPFLPSIKALACWIKGNAKSFKLAASLRIWKDEEMVGKTRQEFAENLREILDAYKCALRYLESEDAKNKFGPDRKRFQEIVRKNLPILKKVEEKQKKEDSSTPVNSKEEKEILKILLGESVEKGSKQEIIIVPPKEKDTGKGYTPGSIGTH